MKAKQEEPRTIKLIKKSNELVEGRYRFDIWESRVFTKMLSLIRMDDEDFKEYRIYLKDVVKDFGLSHKNAYRLLKDGAKGLTKKEIRVIRDTPEGLKEFQTHIAVGVDSFVKEGNYLDISFHPKMKPFLLQLQSQFLMYDIRNVLSIQSSFSVRIYELLKQYEAIGKRKFTIQELKEMLDVQDKYPLYANFKQRVILKAQEDLENSTDIRFTFEEIKLGKQIKELIFHIFKNKEIAELREENQKRRRIKETPPKLALISAEEPKITFVEQEIFETVKDFKGANLKSVQIWMKVYPVDYIKSRIKLVENLIQVGQKIENPMGFIQSMMAQPNIFDPIEEEKQKQNIKIQKEKQEQLIKQQKKTKEQQVQLLKESYEASKLNFMNFIFEKFPNLPKEFLLDLKNKRNEVDAPFIVQLAYDHYTTNIEGIMPMSKEEIQYNYQLGGSFSALVTEWFESNFSKEMTQLRKDFEMKYRDIQ
jgi:plasmid replication initiation protein